MKVLLQADLDSLGSAGQIVNVKPGFARNFLFPKNLAVLADEKNLKVFEHLKRQTEEKIKKIKKASEQLGDKLAALVVRIPCKVGEEDKLFGSVTASNISEELGKLGFEIDRRKIVLEQPLKVLGEHVVKVKLEGKVVADLKLELFKEE